MTARKRDWSTFWILLGIVLLAVGLTLLFGVTPYDYT